MFPIDRKGMEDESKRYTDSEETAFYERMRRSQLYTNWTRKHRWSLTLDRLRHVRPPTSITKASEAGS